MMIKKGISIFLSLVMCVVGTGCVNQSPAIESKVPTNEESPRIVATSMATVEIAEKLDLDLVGVPHSDLTETPERYKNATIIGTPMAPDIEAIKQLQPDWVISPATLQIDLEPKYQNAELNALFVNLESVEGLYKSIQELGDKFDRKEEADRLIEEFYSFYDEFQNSIIGEEQPRVLILMGLPGSYVVATGKSYVGSLVRLSGGINVYENGESNFLVANTEDMQLQDPDIIVRCAHALPDDVIKMFQDEFETNPIWQHFRAVKEKHVYDLPYDQFGMSAKFNYPDALITLRKLFYETKK